MLIDILSVFVVFGYAKNFFIHVPHSVGLKRIGLAKVDHTPPIEEKELKQIYCSSALTTKTPEGLQLKF
jgi:hypothetical protein